MGATERTTIGAGDGFASRKTTTSPIAFKGQGCLIPNRRLTSSPEKRTKGKGKSVDDR
jgi:hypothetical protein